MNLPDISNRQQERIDPASTSGDAGATNQESTLLHVLAADPPKRGRIRVRATVRTGAPKVGDSVWFQGTDCERRVLTIVSMQHSPRWWTIDFLGLEADLSRIVTGTYMHGDAS